jgi:Bax protein
MYKGFFYSGKFWFTISIMAIFSILIILSKRVDKTFLIIDYVTVEKETDITSIKDSLVVPILYSHVQLLSQLSMEKRKNRFFDIMLPAVLIYQHQLNTKREHVRILQNNARYAVEWTHEDSLFINSKFDVYKTKNLNELLRRMKPPPTSIALAQAALESGWGSSRFFKEANNVFGIWSFNSSENRIVANEFRDGEPIYLKKYGNLLGSVEDYHILLASSATYAGFRDCIYRGNNAFELIWYLRMYSEKRDEYIMMLRNVIVTNELTKYDNYRLDSDFFDYPNDDNSLF